MANCRKVLAVKLEWHPTDGGYSSHVFITIDTSQSGVITDRSCVTENYSRPTVICAKYEQTAAFSVLYCPIGLTEHHVSLQQTTDQHLIIGVASTS